MEAPKFIPMGVKRALNRVRAGSMPFGWSLNPYRGCGHGCAFCYARGTHEYLGYGADDAFRSRIHVKEDVPRILEAELEARVARFGGDVEQMAALLGTVAVGTATDPYQSAEARFRVTRRCLEVLSRYRVRFSVTTRSPLILRDLDVLQRARLEGVHVSLHTLDAEVWRAFEPATPPPSVRLRAVERLAKAGVPVSVFIAPVLPYLTDQIDHLAKLMQQARDCGAYDVMVSSLRLAPEVKPWFFSVLKQAYPAWVPRYERMYAGRAYPPRAYAERLYAAEAQARRLAGFAPRAHADAKQGPHAPHAASARSPLCHAEKGAEAAKCVQLRLPL
ncbi:SPL family radical SAM protein [Alicyclobacillus vulcanalis]|uniref:DNA repair photolyase n=1 Tax=Alicyclobacillus vulcanalis TaxID=252246 RepID=A0A1N7JTM3_9BACL|nr:radical SAM protein [Alicyclobacillus vulcanalis]SIS52712.1 DNA repair photolyase [Alicyclobacillus vulcanalis]